MVKLYNWIIGLYFTSAWFIACGFYKLFVYKNDSSSTVSSSSYTYSSPTDIANAYVGADAYNYIINANRATAYFVVALIFAIIGSAVMIMGKMDDVNRIKSNDGEVYGLSNKWK